MPTYTMLSGHELHYELTPEVEPFYERVLSASRDPEVSGARLLELVYSRDNPLLEEGPFGPQVTRAVLDKPLYALFQDLIFRKEVKESGFSVEETAARSSLPLEEAAGRFGLSLESLEELVRGRRLSSWKREGRLFVEPETLEGVLREFPQGLQSENRPKERREDDS